MGEFPSMPLSQPYPQKQPQFARLNSTDSTVADTEDASESDASSIMEAASSRLASARARWRRLSVVPTSPLPEVATFLQAQDPASPTAQNGGAKHFAGESDAEARAKPRRVEAPRKRSKDLTHLSNQFEDPQ